ncbi:hypothetical protein LSH36_284g03002 [Paralvinella palmiformis]|uniref:ANK_REP_REGION domain-containing protein n=1 Tax=Paralvinella palmiformis TaxID=53620 RepID=A0AAD9JIJ2_9ANNE|nr:hypothetical protein LSH36_284g03002 [Paralvinella palmiformis]
MHHAPILCVSAAEGHVDMVSLLLEFNANIMQTGDDHICALSHAARRGHIEVIRHLMRKKAKINQTDDRGQCPLIHAALMGQLDAASFLLQCDWSSVKGTRPNRNESLQQSLITAASVGHKQICEFLLDLREVAGEGFDIDNADTLQEETALTVACTNHQVVTVELLLDRGADLDVPNIRGLPPLLCAAKAGDVEIIDILIFQGSDVDRLIVTDGPL